MTAEGDHGLDLPVPAERGLEAVAEAAELWGASWRRLGTGGRLALPVTAGIRRGVLEGEVSIRQTESGCRLRYRVESSEYAVHRASAAVLLFGALGGLLVIVAPLYPGHLLELLPAAVLLMLVAWFLVAARLRSRGVDDFFGLVGELADAEDSDGEPNAERVASDPAPPPIVPG